MVTFLAPASPSLRSRSKAPGRRRRAPKPAPPSPIRPGTVALVGAGPGDPRLITVRGLECLRAADVVLHDRLVSRELLLETRRGAELIDVGKAPGRHLLKQEEINELLIRHARAGRRVCRLKGGDPFLFGRGGEEAEALAEAGVAFQVVPGITAALGAAASAGIPLTHRDHASQVTLITGHPRAEQPGRAVETASGSGTMVYYMGLGQLGEITSALLAEGRDPQTPVAILQSATTPEEQRVIGTLADIAEKCAERQLASPALIVVGSVVELHHKLRPAMAQSTGTDCSLVGLA